MAGPSRLVKDLLVITVLFQCGGHRRTSGMSVQLLEGLVPGIDPEAKCSWEGKVVA